MRSRYGLGAYLAGATTARTADEMSAPALLLLGLAATGSAGTAALLYAGLTISAAAGGPVLGALLDRSGRPGRLLAGTLAGYAAGLAVITVSLGHVPTAAAVAVAVLAGFLGPSLTGGWTSRLPDVLPPGRLAGGYSLDAATFSAAALAGPALAGLVAAAAGPSWAMAVVTAMLLLATPAAWWLPGSETEVLSASDTGRRAGSETEVLPGSETARRPGSETERRPWSETGRVPASAAGPEPAGPKPGGPEPGGPEPGGPEPGRPEPGRPEPGGPEPGRPEPGRPALRADLRAGIGAIISTPPLLRITICSVVAYLGVGMVVVACPLLGQRYLGSADRGALLLSVIAAASLVTTVVLARWPLPLAPDTVFAAATVLAGAAYAALAVAPGPGWVIAAVAIAGVADGPQLAAIFAVRHREAPPRLRGQVFTTAASLKISAGALGAALAGYLAAHSLPLLLAVAAGTQGAALVAFAVSSGPVRREQPPAPTSSRRR